MKLGVLQTSYCLLPCYFHLLRRDKKNDTVQTFKMNTMFNLVTFLISSIRDNQKCNPDEDFHPNDTNSVPKTPKIKEAPNIYNLINS